MSDELSAAPTPSAGIPWNEHQGALLVIDCLSFEAQVSTSNGIKDAVRANVHVLTGATESEDFEDALIFPTVLMGQAKRSLGLKIVGRLIQGKAEAGKNPPWLLDAPTAEDMAKASTWLQARKPALTSAAPPF